MEQNTNRFGYWQEKILPVEDIMLSPYDLGILRGYGVFDVMRTENGKPFLLDWHWERFENSAKMLGLSIPITKDEYRSILQDLIQKNGFSQSSIRTVLTGGPSEDSLHPQGNETFFILVDQLKPLNEKYYTEGVKLMTLDFGRHFPQAKITQHVAAIKHTKQKEEAGAYEILYIRNGKVLEASTSNVGLFIGDVLVTPKNDILLGITRRLIVQLAEELGFSIEEREVTQDELLKADEVFIMATNKYVVPVKQVDEHMIGNGNPGERTKKLLQAVREFSERC